MTDKKTDEEVLEYFIYRMSKYGWRETTKEDQVIGIKKTVRRDAGTDDIYIDIEGDIYCWGISYSYIDLTSQELKLLAEYKSFIEDLQIEILQQRERIAQYKQGLL